MDNKSKIGSIIIVLIVASIAGTLGKKIVHSFFYGSDDIRSKQVLNKVASEINKSLPMMVDKDTELYSTVGLERTIVYNYRLVNIVSTDISPEKLVVILKPQVKSSACSTPETRNTFLRKGVTLRYTYADKHKHYIANFDVTPPDCGF